MREAAATAWEARQRASKRKAELFRITRERRSVWAQQTKNPLPTWADVQAIVDEQAPRDPDYKRATGDNALYDRWTQTYALMYLAEMKDQEWSVMNSDNGDVHAIDYVSTRPK